MIGQPFFFPAAFIGVSSIPLVLALVPVNRFYGFRTRKTLADSRVWYGANRFGGWLFLVSSAVYLAFAAIWPMNDRGDPRFALWLAHLGMFIAPLLVSTIWTIRRVRRL
jgi:hypothetical protein